MSNDRLKLLLTRRWPEAVEAYLRERFDVTVDEADRPLDASALRSAMHSFDIVCPTVSDRIGADVLNLPDARVRLLASYGVGLDHIDLAAAKRAGIVVTNTPDVLTEATADLAILLMLMASRRAGEGERELRAGAWAGWRPTHLMGQSIAGKLLGLVGFGRIARAVAGRARGFGMRIAYYGRTRADASVEEATAAQFYPSLESLAAEADVLSLHCPGGPATRHLINAALLARMKPSSILVNTARGSVVDEAALADALVERRICSAALDVYEHEPRVTSALVDMPNVVLLPHLGSATLETREAMGMRVASNIEAFISGGEPRDRVA